jgi:hypothetical protein
MAMFEELLDLATGFAVGEKYEKDGFEFTVVKRTRCYATFQRDTGDGDDIFRKRIRLDENNDDYVVWYKDNGPDEEPTPWILHSRENWKKS